MPQYEVEINEVANGIIKGVIKYGVPEQLTAKESIENVLDGDANEKVLNHVSKKVLYLDLVQEPCINGKEVELQFEAYAVASKS